MDLEISPEPADAERRAITEALGGGLKAASPHASPWREAGLDDLRLGGDAAAEELGGHPRVVEP